MVKFTIYGTGCPNCVRLADHAVAAAEELGIDYELEKVEDINGIVEAGVMRTPGLGIDGKVVSEGKVLSKEEIKKMIK